ncbi:MAG: TrbC/VirB2 family protein [Luteibacter sp.]|jgi:type IV secretion system protein VirB2|uniref:TrbC/VirB2 family protein n=1 Tax=Luteibacter sp. TaxID=1886636 RepID=UPI0028098A3E|nr:TrbC/VirB2 family protein [Luteibacter sp.]MDQ7995309.1 TrbC/VirB2 family protein [Luteibacter sp.]
MALSALSTTIAKSKRPLLNTIALFAVLALAFVPELAFADDDTQTKVCGFFGSIKTILNAASIVVVTVAVIFSGYQIAFAHKRISDVTPALIGGVMIGAAAQIAKTVVGNDTSSDQCTTSSFMIDAINTAIHLVSFHA